MFLFAVPCRIVISYGLIDYSIFFQIFQNIFFFIPVGFVHKIINRTRLGTDAGTENLIFFRLHVIRKRIIQGINITVIRNNRDQPGIIGNAADTEKITCLRAYYSRNPGTVGIAAGKIYRIKITGQVPGLAFNDFIYQIRIVRIYSCIKDHHLCSPAGNALFPYREYI